MDSLIEFPLEGGGKLYVEMSESTLHYLSAAHNNWSEFKPVLYSVIFAS